MLSNNFITSFSKTDISESSDNKIVSLESWVLELPAPSKHKDFDDATMEIIGVSVETESGHRGIGYTWTEYWAGGLSVKALIDQVYKPRVLGRPVSWYVDSWFDLWWVTRRLGSGVTMMALSALDIAIWDVRAKVRDVPLADFIGKTRDRVPTYSSGHFSPELTLESLVKEADFAIDNGHSAIKMRVGKNLSDDVERVGAVRDAIGPKKTLMVDANEQLDLASAEWLGKRIEEFDVTWFEEPIPSEFKTSYKRLSEKLAMPIAFGEHLFDLWAFTDVIERECVDIIQPDVCKVGGITGFLRIADVALAHGIPMAAHYIPEIHIHLAATLQHNLYVESFPGVGELMVDSLSVEDGNVLVPTRPGLGVEFHDWVWDAYRIA